MGRWHEGRMDLYYNSHGWLGQTIGMKRGTGTVVNAVAGALLVYWMF
jgi:hypothetical protein